MALSRKHQKMNLKHFCGLNISTSLRVFLLVPWLVILYFGCVQIHHYSSEIQQARQASLSLDISLQIEQLIHELQKERGLTEGFLANNSESYLAVLIKQRNKTDKQLLRFRQLKGLFGASDIPLASIASHQVIKSVYQDAITSSDNIVSQRKSVDLLLGRNYFHFYSDFIDQLIRLISQVQVGFKDIEQSRFSLDFINFIRLQEISGQERGSLNGILNAEQIIVSQLQQVISYGQLQDKLIADLFSLSSGHHQERLKEHLASPVNTQVFTVRQRIYQKLIREEYIYKLEHELGYGGLIHHFKNYIIRGEPQYLSLFEQRYQMALHILSAFHKLDDLSAQETLALTQLEQTFAAYRSQLALAQSLKKQGLEIELIDEQVRIDDSDAVNAIGTLHQYGLNIDDQLWWQISSERIALFREISDSIGDEMQSLARKQESNARLNLIIYLSLFTVIFISALYLSFSVVKRIIKKIKHIADAMKQMQIDHKFNQPLVVQGKDEIAEMAAAFNQMLAERIKSEGELKISAAVFKYASEAIMITNENNEIETVNPAFCAISGYSADEVIGQNPNILNSGKHTASFYQAMWQELEQHNCWQGEIWNKRKNGEIFPEFLAISVVRDSHNKPIQYISLFSDITKHKKYEEDIWLQANYDALTGLPNRKLCLERLHHEINKDQYHNGHLALLFIDLDRFKNVNDTWGHNSGDELLKLAAIRIRQCLRETDTVARFGGDEFVVILAGTANRFDIERITKNILRSLSAPFHLSNDIDSTGNEAVVSASIGITIAPTDGHEVELLLKNADTAMYQAKESGRNAYKFFTASMNKTVTARMKVELALRRAVKNNEFVLHYQPVVSLKSGSIVGAEALIRWQHPAEGLVYPDSFIGVAEETGLIESIGQWVVTQACKDLKSWHNQGLKLNVAVNVSSRQCKQTSATPIAEVIETALAENDIKPNHLKVEITESLLMDNSKEMISTLQKIRSLGVAIHMDDFGTGYSSLSYLKHFPIDVLKIDRSFIEGAIDDKTDASLVEAVVLIGHSLNLKLVGEGIETQQHFDYLQSLGCDFGQGYHISKPIPAHSFIELCLKNT